MASQNSAQTARCSAHCAKSCRPFELFAMKIMSFRMKLKWMQHLREVWLEIRGTVFSQLRWMMLLCEESAHQLHSLWWLCSQLQLRVEQSRTKHVQIACILTWRSERHSRCGTQTSVCPVLQLACTEGSGMNIMKSAALCWMAAAAENEDWHHQKSDVTQDWRHSARCPSIPSPESLMDEGKHCASTELLVEV